MQKILIIGNSHSVDAFHLLPMAYKDQYPEKEIILGVAYYSGCSISQHNDFAKNDETVYRYYKNINNSWNIDSNVSMKQMLQDQEWDIVMLQAAKSDLDDTLNENGRRELEGYINQYITTPHKFMWHTSWPSPNDESFFSENAAKQAPQGYKDNLIRLYGFDPVRQYEVLVHKAKTHILPDKTYQKAICTGTAIMYAYISKACPQTELWRDYTHLNDYGRLIAAYSIVTQITQQPIKTINIETVPTEWRHSQYKSLGDMRLTESMKSVIVDAANYALTDSFGMPIE